MAVTFLQLHNRLRAYLREESISAISATDLLTTALTAILNGAMRRVLDDHGWSFLMREDGVADFDVPYTGTSCWTNGTTTVEIEDNGAAVTAINANVAAWRFALHSDTTNPNLTYAISSATATGSMVGRDALTLSTAFDTTLSQSGTASWTIFANEMALPDTVARVHSVWDEQSELALLFDHQSLGLDPMLPRRLDLRGNPDTVIVGGTIANSATASPTSGMRMAIYPIPDGTAGTRYLLYYRYTYRFADLAAATDRLTGVPMEIADLVVRRAFIDCLMGNIQNDPARGNALRSQYELDLREARARDVRDPLRRLVPRPFGSGRRGLLHPNHRWNTRQVPSPS